ncbi:MAG: HAMP domain-containing protein [Spirobacillus cienkowskii]|jgi:sigma-B regulation protein RsbU (phosphoserine phosphatase)|uniref:HAMP domain-containing protein n=1 Tax=Spirobacillus cienkowskii TaxID=495820 RepID=A0A369KVH5_9BACT|nr:MAG: HAMP domain-containing protein [Spirobacillus cienkowskii]
MNIRAHFKNMRFPLAIKTALALIAIIFVIMGITTYLYIGQNRSEMEAFERKNQLSIFSAALPVVENALWDVDFKGLNSTLLQIMKNENIVRVVIFTEREKVFSYLERNNLDTIGKEPDFKFDDFLTPENKKQLVSIKYDKNNNNVVEFNNSNEETSLLAYPLFSKTMIKDVLEVNKIGYLFMIYSTKKIREANRSIIIKAILLSSLLCIVLIISSFIFIINLVINPIKALEEASIKIANSNFVQTNIQKSIIGHDEIDSLTNNFNHMVTQILKFIEEEKKQQRMANELETARVIQKSFIPKATNLQVGYFEISGQFQSASECGGDWWHFYPLPDKKLMLFLGDVTGHGTTSAMLTAAVKGYCDSIYGRKISDPSIILEELDLIVRSCGGEDLVMTMFVTVIDPINQKMTYSNAAQNFPLIINQESNTESHTTLLGLGKRLGFRNSQNDEHYVKYKNYTCDFKPNNILFVYSDGLTEAKNLTNQREYSERRLLKKLKSIKTLDTNQIIITIQEDLEKFVEGNQFEDDVTFVACRFCKTEENQYTNELVTYFNSRAG